MLNWEEDRDLVIGRILSVGDWESIEWLLRRLGQELGLAHLWIKDESGNPTGSFKARGMATAVSVAQ